MIGKNISLMPLKVKFVLLDSLLTGILGHAVGDKMLVEFSRHGCESKVKQCRRSAKNVDGIACFN